MNLYFHICISICCIIIYLYSNYDYAWKINISDHAVLVIGILSARENFVQREAARLSWLKHFSLDKSNKIKTWFIVGDNDCKIPPQYRLSEYECNKWSINISGISNYFYTSYRIHNENCSSRNVFRQGFSFKVNHPVVIKRLGILLNLLPPKSETKVALLDTQTKEIIIETIIATNSSYFDKGYLYGEVETVLLPKNFEGIVLVEGYLLQEAWTDILWNDGGGVITFSRIFPSPSHMDSVKFSKNIYSAVSIQFLIHDLNGLKSLISQEEKITTDWLKKMEKVDEKILKEELENQDMLVVNVTDTYRSLPLKLLQFYRWIDQTYNFSYLMKTDDDSVIDVGQIINYMENHSSFKKDEPWIWSRFRKDWPVNYIGKWADYDYRSSIYPSFPCGATYVMSHKAIQWLSLNRDYLFPYQGEDVSMGIWLSAIKANFIDDELFECDSTCNKKSYNRAQLTTEQIKEVWSTFEKCQNLCSCD